MQSSTAIAFRALVMLIFLISVPLLAIFGRDLPEVIKGLIDGRLSVQVTEQSQAASGANQSSPSPVVVSPQPSHNPFADAAPYRAAPVNQTPTVPASEAAAGASASSAGLTTSAIASPGSPNTIGMPSPQSPPPLMNAGLNAAIPGSTVAAGNDRPAESPNGTPLPATMPMNPAEFHAPPESRPISQYESTAPNGIAAETPKESPTPTAGDDQFRQAENRLRQLGATHYKLETWGPQNDRYRFECRMAVGGNVGVNRHFEAVEDDPWRAMDVVLRQVEEWQR